MAWEDLTAEQQRFLKQYLDPSLRDRIMGMGSSQGTREVIGSFESFEIARLAFENALNAIPDGYPEKTSLGFSAKEAASQRDAGDFDAGAEILRVGKVEAERVVSVVTTEADRLRLIVLPVVAGALGPEVNELGLLHATATLNGHGGMPTHDALTAARKAEQRLAERSQEITLAVAARELAAAKNDFTSAFDPVKSDLEALANVDVTGAWTSFSAHDQMKNLFDWAEHLLAQAQLAENDDTVATYTSVAQELRDNVFTFDQMTNLQEQALDEFRDTLRPLMKDFDDAIDDARDLDDTDMTETEKSTRKPLLDDALDLLKRGQDAMNGSDPQALLDLIEEFNDTDLDDDLIDFYNDNLQRRKKEQMVSLGVPAERLKGMDGLFEDSYDTYEAVLDIIEKTAKTLGKATVTPAFIDTKRDELTEANKKVAEADKASKEAEALFDKAAKLNNEKAAALKELRKQASAATEESEKQRLAEEVKKAAEAFKLINTEAIEAQKVAKQKKDLLVSETEKASKAAEVLKAAEGQKGVLDAINFGALAPDRSPKLSDASRVEMCKMFMTSPSLGAKGVDALARSEDPEAVATCVKVVNQRIDSGFKSDKGTYYTDPAYRETYAANLIDMSANVDAGMMSGLDDYLAEGRQFDKFPDLTGRMDDEKRGQSSAKHVASGMIDGSGDFDIDAGVERLEDLMFNPKLLANAQPELVKQAIETLRYFDDSEEARDKITDLEAPKSPSGVSLVAKSTGKDPGALTDADTRQTVLTAMLTPIHQGKIGSCFATSNVIRMRKDYPDKTLDHFVELAEKGEYTPTVGDKIPAITNLPDHDNPLVRSLEYSAATVTARADKSTQRTRIKTSAKTALTGLADKFDPSVTDAIDTLAAKLADAFSFTYDPKAKLDKVSVDGSSKFGRYVLLRKDNGTEINSKPEFVAAMRDFVRAAIDEDDLAENVTVDQVVDAAVADGILDAMKRNDKYPWELSSGGFEAQAAKTTLGNSGSSKSLVSKDSNTTSNVKERTLAIVKSLIKDIPSGSGSEDHATVGYSAKSGGGHAFNALPNHDSLDVLRQGDLDDQLDEVLTQKGASLKTTKLPVDQAVFIFEREMNAMAAGESGPAKEALLQAIRTGRPTAEMTPAEVDAAIKQATTAYIDLKVAADVERWKKGLKAKSAPDPTEEEIEKEKTKRRASREERVANDARNRLCKDLAVPELVICDTNWGGPDSKVLIVAAPDPITGDPMLFKRTEPPGTLKPVDKNWIEGSWSRVT